MRGQKDDDDGRVQRQQLLQQLNAVHAGHLEIGQGEIETAITSELQRSFAGSGRGNIVSGAGQNLLQNVALWFVVVNYEYGFSWHDSIFDSLLRTHRREGV